MTSTRPKSQQLVLGFSDETNRDSVTPEPQRGQSGSAVMEKSALDTAFIDLMERIVEQANLEKAWKKVKANRGAPGPDGITVDDFLESFLDHWPRLRQQNSWKELMCRALLGGSRFPNPMAPSDISVYQT